MLRQVSYHGCQVLRLPAHLALVIGGFSIVIYMGIQRLVIHSYIRKHVRFFSPTRMGHRALFGGADGLGVFP